ncbi:C2H2 transcription factor (Rpn4), putative [Talaromyces stipitatus ATCC 10500]|uniref:C2H2 transcription factor (Rpn4), putative n=1 Tax=Talaromyces stipitatus (strain ATCC 10500 / CBS 375.48 / QM 6759 / NRRL 1006) TaxID=441959 RepID=B8M0U3_TALSN|nr:C2H2 transcription factor (Rpn4), putative [Talaromyces stipitatus ATCC 10500]EED21476.1 C2H2 transcription factor (Rpn4), putative [Talaromyces stipitatus ATCC 10500]
MLLYPRNKDLITYSQWPYPNDNTILQDHQLPPNNLYDHQQQLQSPFHSPRLQFVPSSSACPSPTFSSSSPAFSSAHSPATNFSGDFPVFDGTWSEAPSMSAVSSYNPAFHIPAAVPSPYPNAQYPYSSQFMAQSPMLAQSGISPNAHGSWDTEANVQLLSPAHAQKGLAGFHGAHKRAASGSSGKTGSKSPQATTAFTGQYQNPKKSLPTPVQTPTQNSFLAPAFQNYDPSTHNGDTAAAEQAMRQAVMEQHSHNNNNGNNSNSHPATTEDDTSFHYSLAPSVSSLSHHNSPVTPQTTYDEFDDGSKAVVHGEDRSPDFDRWMGEYLQFDTNPDFNNNNQTTMPMGVPKLNRTISDIYQDELYNTTVVPTTSSSSSQQMRKANSNNMVNAPYRNLFADRLNAANQGHLSARSQSPAGNSINRERSPFRQGSPLAADFRQQQQARLQISGLGSALQLPGTQQDEQGQIKTISPKDALLEYNEGPDELAHGLPALFPTTNDMSLSGSNMTSRRQSATSVFQPTLAYNSMETFPTQYATQAAGLQQPLNNFMQPQLQPQDLRHANNSLLQQQTPGFPASLPTMESTNSDGVMETSVKRPNDTSSDSGTYTCTYHGCTLRFETPAKLQKHKREAHRQTMAGGNGDSNSSLALRNSQAGPHKCERINPSTGKPCNSIFSRPYDLTRHEDTIHNARKQKVRCHLCTEEKTFSRNDALTRHMRVVHPEVDWPGKQRRKGRD